MPLSCAAAIGRRARLVTLTLALNSEATPGAPFFDRCLALLLAASLVLAAQIGFGLVFDPRYKDFQFAGLTPIVAAFAFYAAVAGPGRFFRRPPRGKDGRRAVPRRRNLCRAQRDAGQLAGAVDRQPVRGAGLYPLAPRHGRAKEMSSSPPARPARPLL
ncbi:hypothetical protein ACFSKM_10880 [Ancylobacter dichloromethanicus]